MLSFLGQEWTEESGSQLKVWGFSTFFFRKLDAVMKVPPGNTHLRQPDFCRMAWTTLVVHNSWVSLFYPSRKQLWGPENGSMLCGYLREIPPFFYLFEFLIFFILYFFIFIFTLFFYSFIYYLFWTHSISVQPVTPASFPHSQVKGHFSSHSLGDANYCTNF